MQRRGCRTSPVFDAVFVPQARVFDVKLAQTLVESHWSNILIAETLTELLIDIMYVCERCENGTRGGKREKMKESEYVGILSGRYVSRAAKNT